MIDQAPALFTCLVASAPRVDAVADLPPASSRALRTATSVNQGHPGATQNWAEALPQSRSDAMGQPCTLRRQGRCATQGFLGKSTPLWDGVECRETLHWRP